MQRPKPNECAPFYQKYIDELGNGDIFAFLRSQLQEMRHLLQSIDDEKALHRYADGKWSIKEVVGHLIDAERVFSYRALCFARNDPGPLPGMEENDYVRFGLFDARPLIELTEEHHFLRSATIFMFKSFNQEVQMRRGIASSSEFTVRSLAWIIAGHERHHLNILKERYL